MLEKYNKNEMTKNIFFKESVNNLDFLKSSYDLFLTYNILTKRNYILIF